MVPHWYPLCSLLTVLSIGLKTFFQASKATRQGHHGESRLEVA
jgi:hypothetical protein